MTLSETESSYEGVAEGHRETKSSASFLCLKCSSGHIQAPPTSTRASLTLHPTYSLHPGHSCALPSQGCLLSFKCHHAGNPPPNPSACPNSRLALATTCKYLLRWHTPPRPSLSQL